ncbi:MAG: helicase-related protein, partial [Phascolarctobacterium sp.]|nr:helicase-related protein [Phascolarctobacterium sp.]
PYGARYVLADEVGLGKTVQLAMAAELMALYGNKPILVIVPKTLLLQWQSELRDLMGLPSAIWNGKAWIDENGILYPLPINRCPRKIGIVSQGIINNGSDACVALKNALLSLSYECVICDEAHRARRKNLSEQKLTKAPEMNNLYKFLMQISPRTHSMLLATATPVQLYKIEAFDLLNILSQANSSVLGNRGSCWRQPNTSILEGLNLITGESSVADLAEAWHWMRDPLPPVTDSAPSQDEISIKMIRSYLGMPEDEFNSSKLLSDFPTNVQNRIRRLYNGGYLQNWNPYIRHIVRRERSYLENTINPETNQPYLPKVEVVLLGDGQKDSLILEGYLGAAYKKAEEFCELIQERCSAAGLFKTLLLRRIGSSMIAGYNTGKKMLEEWASAEEELFEDDLDEDSTPVSDNLKELTREERDILQIFVDFLGRINISKDADPKYNKVLNILMNGARLEDGSMTVPWKDAGCIIFSQYYDTVEWIAQNLSQDMDAEIGVYAGGNKSGIFYHGEWRNETRDNLKKMVKNRSLKILVGTDAASEGLNLQTLGTLINFDLPWNPTRLEQRKGRIQRIGQIFDTVYVYNLRYKGSVEDRVHELLSSRMESIYKMFGQLPDVLEDVWVDIAVGDIENAKQKINEMPQKHPFALKYHENVKAIDWESCSTVLDKNDIKRKMLEQW